MATRAARGLGQYSGVARAIERVGERWALLIIRDLLVGARRYSDLKAGLPRIPTNILSDRLKELQEAGVIRRVPTVRGGYELTELGRALEPVIVALERWGWSTLGEPAEGELVTADALAIALGAAFQPDAAARAAADRVRAARGRRLGVGDRRGARARRRADRARRAAAAARRTAPEVAPEAGARARASSRRGSATSSPVRAARSP